MNPSSIQTTFELLGTALFAVSGALRATDKARPDWLGVTFVGFVTAIGGGSLRDLLLGHYPLGWVRDPNYLYAIFTGIVVARVGYGKLVLFRRERLTIEALGLGMFSVLGAEKALLFGAPPLVAALMGMFTAVMGGVIRDTLTNREPIIFSKEIYATACILGAGLFVLLEHIGVPREVNLCLGGLVTFAIRIAALKFKWSLPEFPSPATAHQPQARRSGPAFRWAASARRLGRMALVIRRKRLRVTSVS